MRACTSSRFVGAPSAWCRRDGVEEMIDCRLDSVNEAFELLRRPKRAGDLASPPVSAPALAFRNSAFVPNRGPGSQFRAVEGHTRHHVSRVVPHVAVIVPQEAMACTLEPSGWYFPFLCVHV